MMAPNACHARARMPEKKILRAKIPPVSGPTGLRGHRRSPPLGCPKLLRRPGQLTRGGRLRQSNRSVWSGFHPDMSERAWQRPSSCVLGVHSIGCCQDSSSENYRRRHFSVGATRVPPASRPLEHAPNRPTYALGPCRGSSLRARPGTVGVTPSQRRPCSPPEHRPARTIPAPTSSRSLAAVATI
jgi:hypothetical protein